MRRVNEKDYNNRAEYEYAQRKHEFFIEDLKRYNIRALLIDEYKEITDILNEIDKRLNHNNVFISGSAQEYGKYTEKEALEFIESLSKELILQDFNIISGFGVVAVIMKVDNSYEWFKKSGTNCHGSSTVSYELDKVFDIISQNHFNSNPEQWHCDKCKTYDWLNGSYITFVEEETFMDDPEKYINNAYDKSENDASGYDLVKQR